MNHLYTYYCKNLPATVAVIDFLKSIGFCHSYFYGDNTTDYAKSLINEFPLMQINTDAKDIGGNFTDYGYPKLTMEQIFEMFAPKPTEVKIKLNTEYSAIVHKDGTFKVGCQTFTQKNLTDIQDAIKALNS